MIKFISNVVSTFTFAFPSLLSIRHKIFATLPPGNTSIESTQFVNFLFLILSLLLVLLLSLEDIFSPPNIEFNSQLQLLNFSLPENRLAPSENRTSFAYGKMLLFESFPSRKSRASCRKLDSTAGDVPLHSNVSQGSFDKPLTSGTSISALIIIGVLVAER